MNHNLMKKQVEQVKRAKKSIHNKTINKLVDRLLKSHDYDVVETNIEYKLPYTKSVIGEIDTYAIKYGVNNNYLLLFEVKSNDSVRLRRKGLQQLEKHETILGDNADRIFKFLVTPNKIEWIHRSHPNYSYLRP